MAEKWVVVTLISRDFGGSWNPVRRLLETDSRARRAASTDYLT